jgi:hypothetical protein
MYLATIIQLTNETQNPTVYAYILNDNQQLFTVIALGISLFSVAISAWTLWIQRIHNRLSVKPLGNIEIVDLSSEITLKLCNSGLGPLIITSMETVNREGLTRNHPFDWLPTMKYHSHNKLKGYRTGDNVRSGMDDIFFDFKFIPKDEKDTTDPQILLNEKRVIRNVLKELTIKIRYKSIYGEEQKEIVQSLDGFGHS